MLDKRESHMSVIVLSVMSEYMPLRMKKATFWPPCAAHELASARATSVLPVPATHQNKEINQK
jgi:hypothetical protein